MLFRSEALRANATEARERWGCGQSRTTPLPPDLAAEARHVARVTGAPEAETCPLACVTYADPWVVELTRAVSLAGDWHVPLTESLGRDLVAVDIEALAELKQAQGAAWESDRKIEEHQRKRDAKRGAR